MTDQSVLVILMDVPQNWNYRGQFWSTIYS